MSLLRTMAVPAVLAILAACSAPPPPQSPGAAVDAKEQSAVDALNLKKKYADVVTGDDVKGNVLRIYVDRDNLDSMDESSEDAMVADILARWKSIWRGAHRGKHATVTVSLRDYYGTEIFHQSAKG